MKKFYKWQKKYLNKIVKYSNSEVLEEFTELAGGDSYDGSFTKRGEWEFEQIQNELHKRLENWLETGEI